ncbi:MAG TPA: xanthine dehydrogenase family protein molybdopterin-binding subunit [Candidatus Lambdaproteobacteria bacterium]|jgi:isoquinoline 1-oxidoreductase beta subunit|nr:xanthine dehydrogenase family protein molybdopterin-binding subunit [Candidatus Lambdaproteobacteria bacterium]
MGKYSLSRRVFLKKSALTFTGLIIGFTYEPESSLAVKVENAEELGIWIRIAPDGSTTLIVPSSEMGQGVNTSLSMILAEELEADWQSVKTETAPVNSKYINPESNSGQMTAGSSSVKGFWNPLRKAGAAVRLMLQKAAAQKWEIPIEECVAKSGYIYRKNSSQKLSYGELAEAAGKIDIPSDPPLKNSKDYNLVGKSIKRIDIPSKTNGSAQFGIDVRLPEMMYATIRQSPVFGGEVLSYDEDAAKSIRGVKKVTLIPNGIAVIADNTWRAKRGMEVLNLKFHGGETIGLESQQVQKELLKALDDEGKTKIEANKVLDLEYEVPFLAHAPLEPMNCTANVTDNFCEVWVPTQSQGGCMDAAKEITGLDEEQIQIHTTYLGGGFGRRGETDYVKQSLILAKALGKPIKVTWMREEDMQHDFYRPASMSRFQIGLNKDGFPISWNNQLASPSILKRFFAPMAWFNIDPLSTEGADEIPYVIEDFNIDYSEVDSGVPVGFWHSVGSSFNAFFTESAIDEAAHLAQQDQFDYRMKLLSGKPRFQKVLEKVMRESKWGRILPKGHGLGISIHKTRGSIAGAVIEVSTDVNGMLNLNKAWIAIDCGKVINPNTVRAQMEGGFTFGLSATLGEEITLKDGRVEQSNFHDYSILRLKGSPDISVEIIESGNEIGGVGEVAVPLAAPALTNAIFSSSGRRIRSLPLSKHGIKIT